MAPPHNQRTGFSRRAQNTLFISYVVAGGGAIVAAILLVVSTLNPPLFAALRAAVAEVTTPVATGLTFVRRTILDLPGGFGDYFGVVNANRTMHSQLERERTVVLRARTLSIENQRLRRLLQLRDDGATTIVTARLVSSSASSTRRFATLNAGRLQGVLPGQPVRGPEGLIGRVLETGPNTARVLLIGDAESIVPVRRTRDGLPAIVTGRGDGLLEVRSANAVNVQFLVGDAFVTSGAGGLYPPGVPVGRATEHARDSVTARGFADPDTLDFAIVQRVFLPSLPPPAPPKAAK